MQVYNRNKKLKIWGQKIKVMLYRLACEDDWRPPLPQSSADTLHPIWAGEHPDSHSDRMPSIVLQYFDIDGKIISYVRFFI